MGLPLMVSFTCSALFLKQMGSRSSFCLQSSRSVCRFWASLPGFQPVCQLLGLAGLSCPTLRAVLMWDSRLAHGEII